MFVGDFVFKESVGRCDLPGGDEEELHKSIQKLMTYPENITLYPGHYDETTLKYEKENNPFF